VARVGTREVGHGTLSFQGATPLVAPRIGEAERGHLMQLSPAG